MKAKSRRQFTSEFKVKAVLEVLRQDKTLNQIASEHKLHPQLVQSKLDFQFKHGRCSTAIRSTEGAQKPIVDEIGPLYKQIGRLQRS